MVRLFRVKNQLPDNWYNLTDEAILTATDVRDLEKLKTALKEQAQSFWITEREKLATWYLYSKASLRAKIMRSGRVRISIKSFNQ